MARGSPPCLLERVPLCAYALLQIAIQFEECLSKCVYEQTKITKGVGKVEVVSRTEAYGICKPKCATSKEQLLLGQPKK